MDRTIPDFIGGWLSVAARSRIGWLGGGWKRENQDIFSLLDGESFGLLGVFDGHGPRGRDMAIAACDGLLSHAARAAGKVGR